MNIAAKTRCGAIFQRCRSWFFDNFSGTEPALVGISSLVTALVAGAALAATFWPQPVGYIVFSAGVLALMCLAFYLVPAFLRKVLGRGLAWLIALAALACSVIITVKQGAGEGWTWRVYLFSAVVTAVLWLLSASWWSMVVRRRRSVTTVLTGTLSAGLTMLLAVFLFTDGFDNHYIEKYLSLLPEQERSQISLEKSLNPGEYTVNILDYGPGQALEGGTVNLTQYMNRDTEDLTGNYVDVYMEYDLNQVPLQGRVWYPAEKENCPVLFIAHGNHEITTQSYLGYNYLGEYLASHGYVVVSVDHNACNMLINENDGRAVLLLEHIGLILQYGKEKDNPLFGKLDEENLAIAGHSRGGEMVATAYLFNGYDRYPENGTIQFDYHYNIKSIIAIAPTVNQYMPADHAVALEDVNYLLLHGAADRDVTSFMGMAQYENISFTGQGSYLKTALYIAGANHGQFNTLWGEYDQIGPFSPLLNVEGLLEEEEQQRIARTFIKVFLDVTLLDDNTNRSLLTDWDRCKAQLPDTVYIQCWQSSAFTPIADYEEDSDLETASVEGVTLDTQGVNWWTEELMSFAGNTGDSTYALRLRWSEEGRYIISLPMTDLRNRTLAFDICDLNEGAVEKGRYALVDGKIFLMDAAGRQAYASISDFAAVFPILPVRTDKLDYLFDTCTYKNAFATVSIPSDMFISEGEEIDLSRITEIRFVFEKPGQVAIDNIGLETY